MTKQLKDEMLAYVSAYQQKLAVQLTSCDLDKLETIRHHYNAIGKLITNIKNIKE